MPGLLRLQPPRPRARGDSPNEEQARWLLGQVPSIEDAALFIAVDGVLRDQALPPSLRAQAAPVLRKKLAQLAAARPQSMQLRLLHFLAGTDEDTALGSKDLEALEAVAALPTWKETSFAHTFQEARRHLKEAGAASASGRAFTVATLSVTDRGSYLLQRRAEATRAGLLPGARRRLGRILHVVGARMAEQPTLEERMSGLQLMRDGAADMKDSVEGARIAALVEEARAMLDAERKAALEQWPLPALQEELLEASARDTWAHLRAFVELGER